MDAETVAAFFGLLLFGGLAGVIALYVYSPARSTLITATLPLAALVATGATAGSLYFSERAGFIPCELCWYQRIAMYPTAILLVIGVLRRDRQIMSYTIVLSSGGLIVSAYHTQLQWFPDQTTFCDPNNPCSARWVEAFGWLTIPQMAGLAFLLIIVLTVLSKVTPSEELP